MLSKDDILSADDLARETVDVPEWGGSVLVGEMNGIDRMAFEEAMMNDPVLYPDGAEEDAAPKMTARGLLRWRVLMVIYSAINDDGSRIFDIGNIDALEKKSREALYRLAEAADRLNVFTQKAVEERIKNSSAALNGDSIED